MIATADKMTELDGSLEGQFLIAMPSIADGCFARSVVFVCAHSDEGAMGLIVNLPSETVVFCDLLEQLDIIDDESADQAPAAVRGRPVYIGGPVSTSRGFVLHSPDYFVSSSSVRVCDDICLTSTLDILKAIAGGTGPERSLLALGYSGWAPGQLEDEFSNNGWLNCPADAKLLFDGDPRTKYERALMIMGVSSSHLSGQAGRA